MRKLSMKWNRRTCAKIHQTETCGTMLSTAGQPITALACGGRRAGRTGKGGERWKVLQQKSRHLRLEGPWCPSAVDVKLRVWSLPLGGPWALWSHTSPPIFNRQACSGPTLAFFTGRIREQLWWTSSLPLFSLLFLLFLLSYHFQHMLCTLRNLHNALHHLLKAFCLYSTFSPPLKLILFNNICLYASSIFSPCLISEPRRIPQQDWPVTYKIFFLLSISVRALWLSWNTLRSLPFVWHKPFMMMSVFWKQT